MNENFSGPDKISASLGAESTSCDVKNILNKKRNPKELILGSLKTKVKRQVVGMVSHESWPSVGNGKLPKKSKPRHIKIENKMEWRGRGD